MTAERYARHALVPGWDQRRLADAGVVIIGMGALGNEVARILALSGVGTLTLADPDRIEPSNLSRCALFRPADVGRLKVEAAAAALGAMVPDIRIQARPLPLARGIGLAELRDADLVLGCLDSRAARVQLAGRCNLVRAPMIDGGTHPWGGEVRPFLDPDGPCYGCTVGVAGRAAGDDPWSCADAAPAAAEGATAAASVLVGGWMALIALRQLLGQDTPDHSLHIEGPAGRIRRITSERDPSCPLHHPAGRPRVLPVGHRDPLRRLLDQLPPGAIPLAWQEIEQGRDCIQCGHHQDRVRPPPMVPDSGRIDCPDCGARLWPQTTLELDALPPDLTLESMGIAPREILAVRIPGQGADDAWQWVELTDD